MGHERLILALVSGTDMGHTTELYSALSKSSIDSLCEDTYRS